MSRGPTALDLVYHCLDTEIGELWTAFGGLPKPGDAPDIWRDICFDDAYHSTALAGNGLVLKEVEALLTEERAVGRKQLKEYGQVKGYADAANWVYSQAAQRGAGGTEELVSLTDVLRVHDLATTPAWAVERDWSDTAHHAPGSLRQVDLEALPGGMRPARGVDVAPWLDSWLAAVGRLGPRTLDFAEELAALHSHFERIHPFVEGNGRVGRLVIDLALVRLGYPPVIIYSYERDGYLHALRRADEGEFGELAEMLARAILDNIYRFSLPSAGPTARLVRFSDLATEEVPVSALRSAALRGRLQATKGPDGHWRSSRAWVEAYLEKRWRRGFA